MLLVRPCSSLVSQSEQKHFSLFRLAVVLWFVNQGEIYLFFIFTILEEDDDF